jgi:hypothetical protein
MKRPEAHKGQNEETHMDRSYVGSQGQVVTRPMLNGPQVARQSSSFLYSANKIATTTTTSDLDFFTVGVGATGQGFGNTPLTYTETNLQTGRRIPDQEKWGIREIGFALKTSCSVADAKLIMDFSYLWFDKPDYRFVFGPPIFFPAGCGLAGVSDTSSTEIVSNGWPTATARVRLRTPLIMDPGETFAFHLTFSVSQTLAAAQIVYLMLWGETVKAIVQ